MRLRLMIPFAATATLLAACGAFDAPRPDESVACQKRWRTVISLARCALDIEAPPEAAASVARDAPLFPQRPLPGIAQPAKSTAQPPR